MPKFEVTRSIEIDVAPEIVFAAVSDYGTWAQWSPWLCAEPDAKVTITSDSSSVGSVYSWDGEIVGKGEIEHQSVTPPAEILDEIRIQKPFKSISKVSFNLTPVENGTSISWTMNGALPWFLFWMRPMMESMIGMDYERGLRMLKEFTETGTVASNTLVNGVQEVRPRTVVGVRRGCSISDLAESMEQAFAEARDGLLAEGMPDTGEMISVYHVFDMKTQAVEYTAGYVVPEAPAQSHSLATYSIPASRALNVRHTGCYGHLGNGWSAAYQHARYKKIKLTKRCDMFEIYRNCPQETPAVDLITDIYLPVR